MASKRVGQENRRLTLNGVDIEEQEEEERKKESGENMNSRI